MENTTSSHKPYISDLDASIQAMRDADKVQAAPAEPEPAAAEKQPVQGQDAADVEDAGEGKKKTEDDLADEEMTKKVMDILKELDRRAKDTDFLPKTRLKASVQAWLLHDAWTQKESTGVARVVYGGTYRVYTNQYGRRFVPCGPIPEDLMARLITEIGEYLSLPYDKTYFDAFTANKLYTFTKDGLKQYIPADQLPGFFLFVVRTLLKQTHSEDGRLVVDMPKLLNSLGLETRKTWGLGPKEGKRQTRLEAAEKFLFWIVTSFLGVMGKAPKLGARGAQRGRTRTKKKAEPKTALYNALLLEYYEPDTGIAVLYSPYCHALDKVPSETLLKSNTIRSNNLIALEMSHDVLAAFERFTRDRGKKKVWIDNKQYFYFSISYLTLLDRSPQFNYLYFNPSSLPARTHSIKRVSNNLADILAAGNFIRRDFPEAIIKAPHNVTPRGIKSATIEIFYPVPARPDKEEKRTSEPGAQKAISRGRRTPPNRTPRGG